MDNTELQLQLDMVKQELKAFKDEYYSNNFSAHQDFNKSSNFTTRIKMPHYDILPSTCEVGELVEKSGKLYVCSSPNTFTIVGTQS